MCRDIVEHVPNFLGVMPRIALVFGDGASGGRSLRAGRGQGSAYSIAY